MRREKAPIKGLYRAFKGAEKRLDSLQQQITNREQGLEQQLSTANTEGEAPGEAPGEALAATEKAGDSQTDLSAVKTNESETSAAGNDTIAGVDRSPRPQLGTGDDSAIPNASSNSSQAQELKAEKKRLKREIQAWIEEFENREGHPPTSE